MRKGGFRWSLAARSLLSLVALLALTGCPYESHEPLSAPGSAKIDKSLLGRWKLREKDDREAGFLTISRFNENEVLLVMDEEGKKGADMMRGFVTDVDGYKFMNLQEMKGRYEDRKWIFVSYKTAGCSLSFRVVNDSLSPASGRTLELIRKNLTNKNAFDAETVLTCVKTSQ